MFPFTEIPFWGYHIFDPQPRATGHFPRISSLFISFSAFLGSPLFSTTQALLFFAFLGSAFFSTTQAKTNMGPLCFPLTRHLFSSLFLGPLSFPPPRQETYGSPLGKYIYIYIYIYIFRRGPGSSCQEDLSNYEQAFIAACTVYVAFVLASPRGKNILQDAARRNQSASAWGGGFHGRQTLSP